MIVFSHFINVGHGGRREASIEVVAGFRDQRGGPGEFSQALGFLLKEGVSISKIESRASREEKSRGTKGGQVEGGEEADMVRDTKVVVVVQVGEGSQGDRGSKIRKCVSRCRS